MESIIKTTKAPLLIKNTLRWELLHWDLDKWKDILGKEKLLFRSGKNMFTPEPQFENTTDFAEMTFDEFLNMRNEAEWFYFDYKYLKDWFTNCEELRKEIYWRDVGFPEMNVQDSTIWIGSKGAHTPCHVDTYGCNIVAQIFGRKRWLLFPPEEDLESTRIPYEESSTFSKINFFAPSLTDITGIKNCYSVILNPGDVLVVPHKWWHYVENLEVAISINTWINLPIDYEERIKEAIVSTTVIQYLKGLDPDIQKKLITTNAEPNMFKETSLESFDLIAKCLQHYRDHKVEFQQNDTDLDIFKILKVLPCYPNIEEIQPMTQENFQKLFEDQSRRFSNRTQSEEDPLSNIKRIIDAFVHKDVIEAIYKKLTE